MALTRVSRIDGLMSGAGGTPIGPGDGDREAVGIVQDLLKSQGFTRLPDPRSTSYGSFGDMTREAVLAYRAQAGLGAEPRVDSGLLADLAGRAAPQPVASRGYLALALDFEWTDELAAVVLTGLFESGGRFDCLNLNTDRAGLSFGIVQWAQKPGRLHELLQAFDERAPSEFLECAVDGEGLLKHTGRPWGGVNRQTGESVDALFALTKEPWKSRFLAMGRQRELQRIQVDMALAAFRAAGARVRARMPAVSSQRGLAFALDVANQHGEAGARSIYQAVAAGAHTEAELLDAMAAESVRRVAAQFGAESPEAVSTASRRNFFRTCPWLSETATAWA